MGEYFLNLCSIVKTADIDYSLHYDVRVLYVVHVFNKTMLNRFFIVYPLFYSQIQKNASVCVPQGSAPMSDRDCKETSLQEIVTKDLKEYRRIA